MSAEQLHLIDGLEQDFAHAETISASNVFHDRLLQAMNMRGLKDCDVVRVTGIAWSTWHQWISGQIEAPLAGEDFKNVCRLLRVSSDFLIGLSDDLSA